RTNQTAIVQLFSWQKIELDHIKKLKLAQDHNGGDLSKQYKHLCYLMKTFFAVAIVPSNNLTMNPTCEWQLKFYGQLKIV
ncbi:MAG: hypothetical protein AAGM67_12370, partial [Bacteroidota bacterium]